MWQWLQSLTGGAATAVGSFIGSFIGFLALLGGALFNFHLNRKRDLEIRRYEAASVAAALYGEVVLLRVEIARMARAVATNYVRWGTGSAERGTFDKYLLEFFSVPEPILFKSLASKLAVMDHTIVICFNKFYFDYEEARRNLKLLVEDEDRPYSYRMSTVLKPARDAVIDVETALIDVERMLRISKSAPRPDLGQVDDVIEMEDDLSQVAT